MMMIVSHKADYHQSPREEKVASDLLFKGRDVAI